MRRPTVTNNMLAELAASSLWAHGNLSELWEYARQARKIGMLKLSDIEIRRIIEDRWGQISCQESLLDKSSKEWEKFHIV